MRRFIGRDMTSQDRKVASCFCGVSVNDARRFIGDNGDSSLRTAFHVLHLPSTNHFVNGLAFRVRAIAALRLCFGNKLDITIFCKPQLSARLHSGSPAVKHLPNSLRG
jgi:hypothetical protein